VTFFLRALAAACLLLASASAIAQSRTATPGGPPPAAGQPDAAQVLLSEGDTMLVRGSSFSTPVRSDVPIRSGDRIRTGPDGRVQLRFADGALMSIAPGSDFRVEAYAFDAQRQRSFFELMQGSVRAVSGRIGKRDPDDFRLRTPTATIGIRGTEFTVDETVCPAAGCAAGATPGLVVAVIEGRVSVRNEAGSVVVPAGATLRLRDARTVPALAAAPARRSGAGSPVAPPERMGPPATAIPIDPAEHGAR
jgi:hypothetical protein